MRDSVRGWFDAHPTARAVCLGVFVVVIAVLIPLAFAAGEVVSGVILLVCLPAPVISLVRLLRTGSVGS